MKKKQLLAATLLVMKITIVQLTLILIFTFSLHAKETAGQGILDKKISMSAENMQIRKVISNLQNQTGVKFIYSPNTIHANRKISFSVQDKTLEVFFNEIIRPLSIDYKLVGEQVLLFPVNNNAQAATDSNANADIEELLLKYLYPV